MLASNLSSVFFVTRAVLPGMAQRGRGRIINVASTAGLTGYAYVSAYVAAKHGVVGLTRALALEYARRGVTVNAVCPGYTDTPLVAEAAANIVAKTGRSEVEARLALAKVNPHAAAGDTAGSGGRHSLARLRGRICHQRTSHRRRRR